MTYVYYDLLGSHNDIKISKIKEDTDMLCAGFNDYADAKSFAESIWNLLYTEK